MCIDPTGGGGNIGGIVGGVVGATVGIGVSGTVVIIVWIRKRNKNTKQSKKHIHMYSLFIHTYVSCG